MRLVPTRIAEPVDTMKKLVWKILKPLYQIIRPTFTFNNEKYPYFWHEYNMTWRGERAVEIPIMRKIVEQAAGKKILEVGNVLSHYFLFPHDIVDKYEKAPGVNNEDVVTYRPHSEPYDLILCISTLEHVGWDEEPKDPEKFFKAFENLIGPCLKLGGKLVVTLPLGHNQVLDQAVAEKKIAFSQMHYLKRVRRVNGWEESDLEAVRNSREMDPYPFANALFIGVFVKPNR